MNFGEKVKVRRKELSMTQTELADAVGITQQTVFNIEKGTNKGSKYIVKMAEALRVTPDWLHDEAMVETSEQVGILSADEKILIINYRLLDQRGQKTILHNVEGQLEYNR